MLEMSDTNAREERDGVPLTNLDQPLFDGAGATKRDLVDYLDAVQRPDHPGAREPAAVGDPRSPRARSVHAEERPEVHAASGCARLTFGRRRRSANVSYALCNDRRTLLWFANQRAIEYHPSLVRVERPDRMTHLVLDLDPPEGDAFASVVRVARPRPRTRSPTSGSKARSRPAARRACTSSCRSTSSASMEDAAAATRAIAARAEKLDPAIATTAFMKEDRGGKVFVDATRVGGATVIAAYSPRVRPGVPVSFPLRWDDLDDVVPGDFTVHNAVEQLEAATHGPS